jgi:urease accessory protein
MPDEEQQLLPLLQLLHLADSALPIGTAAHSFGLETLTTEDRLTVKDLETFLRDYLAEAATLEGVFCRWSYALGSKHELEQFGDAWLALNARLSALKTARESRVASGTLGRRLLQLVFTMDSTLPLIQQALTVAKRQQVECHYSTAFGLIGHVLAIDCDAVVSAYIQQTITSLISACQRLLPLGQNQANTMLWRLRPVIIDTAHKSASYAQQPENISIFTPLLDLASMRHPTITTRLFIS